MADTDLAAAMITRADADGLPDGHDMRSEAAAFDEAAKGFFSLLQTCDVKKFMGCWARARRAWCDYTGNDGLGPLQPERDDECEPQN